MTVSQAPPCRWHIVFFNEVCQQLPDELPLNLGTDSHGVQMINPNDFGVTLTFYLAPPPVNTFTYAVKFLNIYTNWHKI